MKLINYIFLVLFVAFSYSCDKDFLERMPLDELAPSDFFDTPEQLELYANRFYVLLPAHTDYFNTFWIDRNSDNLVPTVFDPRLGGTRTIPSSAAAAGWVWTEIRQANYFLQHCNTANGTRADINHYIGEVRFFRAFLYFDKLKNFGDVPWTSKVLNTSSPELYMARTNRKAVVDSILADLDSAIINLKSSSIAEKFRINKEVAMLLKARVCLYEGTWEKYHAGTPFGVNGSDGTTYLEKAAETSGNIIQQNNYGIYKGPAGKEYGSLFIQTDYSDIKEVMLWKKFNVGLQVANNVSRSLSGGGGNIGMSKGLIDSYLCTDGKPISLSPEFGGYDSLELEAANRDPRLPQSLFLKGYDQLVNAPGTMNQKYNLPPLDGSGDFRNTTGYGIYKGVNPEYSQQANNLNGTTGSIIFRYAEVLLINAEAKAELGTVTQADIDNTINLLRDRVNMPHLEIDNIANDPNWDFPSLSPIINEIRRERRVELACEGMRWDDLARWRAHQLITGKRPKGVKYLGSNLEGAYKDYQGTPTIFVGVNLFVDENGFVDPYQNVLPNGFGFDPNRDYLSPIPSDEITLNSNMGQNPGWE
jgi:starch-binding outer membrane protein, SusD/RagB family